MRRIRQTYAEAIIMAGTLHSSSQQPVEDVVLATRMCDAWQCCQPSDIGPVHGAYYCAQHAAQFGINQAD